jgi:hypothetical protein
MTINGLPEKINARAPMITVKVTGMTGLEDGIGTRQ